MRRGLMRFVAGALAVVLGCELALRVLPVSTATETGYHLDPQILSYPPHHRWTVATGWDLRNAQTLKANNLGFAAEQDFVPAPHAVALIGDSYVEASMLDAADRPGPALQRQLGGARPVYAFGGPGSSMLDYAERIRFASQRTQVRDFVVLMEAGDVRQALCGSGNVHAQCLDPRNLSPRTERLPPPGTAKRWLRHSAFAQYLFSQLKADPARLWARLLRPDTPRPSTAAVAPSVVPPYVDAIATAFFDRVQPFVKGRLVFVVDGRRGPGVPLPQAGLDLERARFMQLARERGHAVVDAEEPFFAHARQSQRLLEVGPYDRHLNDLGVDLLMRAAAQTLR